MRGDRMLAILRSETSADPAPKKGYTWISLQKRLQAQGMHELVAISVVSLLRCRNDRPRTYDELDQKAAELCGYIGGRRQ